MKPASFIIAVIIFPFACFFSKNDSKAISGTYVRVLDTELNTVYDTISFMLVGDETYDVYQISQRASTYFKKQEDKSFNKRADRNITGTYDPKNHIMRTPDPGIVYSFDLKNAAVRINAITFRKIQ